MQSDIVNEHEFFPKIFKQKETEKQSSSQHMLINMSFSPDGNFIGVVRNSGDCDVYDGAVPFPLKSDSKLATIF